MDARWGLMAGMVLQLGGLAAAVGPAGAAVPQRDERLLAVTSVRAPTPAAPVRVALRVARGAAVDVRVNGRRADHAFTRHGTRLVGRLGANDGLRYGPNRITAVARKRSPTARQSTFDRASRTVDIPRVAPIASAGRDREVTKGAFVELNGAATLQPSSSDGPIAWQIVDAPDGSHATLRDASTEHPGFVPDRPGEYRVRLSAGDASAESDDTAVLRAQPDVNPSGLKLDTIAPDGRMLVDGTPVPGSRTCCDAQISYVIFNRQTLQRVAGGSVDADSGSFAGLERQVEERAASRNFIVALTWSSFSDGSPLQQNQAIDRIVQKLGVAKLTSYQRGRIGSNPGAPGLPGSAVGVAGGPTGSGFVMLGDTPQGGPGRGGLSGWVRMNGATGKADFVLSDSVDFDTEANQTDTEVSPAELTIKVADRTFTRPNPGSGASGFHLLTLNAQTLDALTEEVYATNDAAGAAQAGEVQRLASNLMSAVGDPRRPLVILQAFGTPHSSFGAAPDPTWDQAAKQVERLGGTRQVFDAMNANDPRPLNGESAGRRGPYAFVGRLDSAAPRAEASYSLDGVPARIRGVLLRAHDGGYEPMLAGPARSDGQAPVNTELLRIVGQARQPFPAFKDADGRPVDKAAADAVQRFLGGPEVTGLCSRTATVCDIRKAYYENYNGESWPSVQDDLANAKDKCVRETATGTDGADPPAERGEGARPRDRAASAPFTLDQCEGIRAELRDEVSRVSKVVKYFGPNGLQQPFGASSVAALADLGQISNDVFNAVSPPAQSDTTSFVLEAISKVISGGAALPPPASNVATGLAAAFAVAGYFTTPQDRPNLIGAKITTKAAQLGVELSDRYRRAGTDMDDVGRLIVGDYGMLTAVAAKTGAAPGPGEVDWRLGNVAAAQNALRLAAKQTIYQRLVPLAYPVMYDLGRVPNARNWLCAGPDLFQIDKYLFADQADGAQFVGRFPADNWGPTIAVAEARAVGSGRSARIRGIPASIANPLFEPAADGGLGLSKLEFYSPQNGFRYFPSEPKRWGTSRGVGLIGTEWDTLTQNPRQAYPNALIACSQVPDPPGNSG